MEQSAGDGAATFSLRVEKRTTLERYREKKRKKKKNEREECELLFRLGRSNRSLENRKVH